MSITVERYSESREVKKNANAYSVDVLRYLKGLKNVEIPAF